MTHPGPAPRLGSPLFWDAGSPDPLGATVRDGGVNFSVVSTSARAMALWVFEPGAADPHATIPLDAPAQHSGDRWHVFLRGVGPGLEYLWRVEPQGVLVLDPYTRRVSGADAWRERPQAGASVHGYRCVVEAPLPPAARGRTRPRADGVIYELHVRGFTQDVSSGVTRRGTYAGLIEKLPYLRDLGVTAIELLPIHEFDETENTRTNPLTGERLVNFWGYSPIAFFPPKAAYAADASRGARAELRDLVHAAHAAGIEVILDVVFNHTGEGPAGWRTFSFRGLDDPAYYLHDPATGAYLDVTGCGNTFAAAQPAAADMIRACLRSLVEDLGVDGFRFDLASALTRSADGPPLARVPLLDAIAADPVLAGVTLIAEPWDAAGLYQVGDFPGDRTRWSEWNGRFRDAARRFVRGEAGAAREMTQRMAGSPDLYAAPTASINFVTCHDGFTLADAVSYERAHNEANGENGRDGARENLTWNCGIEGPTDDPAVRALRARQMRNLLALTLLAHGVPMLLAGDEMARTQRGNNNAYSQDSSVSWIDWALARENADLVRFVRALLAVRRAEPVLRPASYAEVVTTPHLEDGGEGGTRRFAVHHASAGSARHVYIAANAHWEAQRVALPVTSVGPWRRVVDTALPSPDDVVEAGAPIEAADAYDVAARSVVMLTARA